MHLVSMNELTIKTSKAEGGAELILIVTPAVAATPILEDLQRKKSEGKREIDLKLKNSKGTNEAASGDPPPQHNTATDLSILYRLEVKAKTVVAPSRSLGITCRCVPFVGIYIDSVKETSSLQGKIYAGDIIIAVNEESTHLASINEVCIMLSTDVGSECNLSVVPSCEARPLLEALYRKNMEEKKAMKQLFGSNDPSKQKQKLHGQSESLPKTGEENDEAMDLTVLLRLKKVAKTIVAPGGGLGWVCRSIPYVGICVEKVLPTSPLLNIVCKGDVIIAVNEQSTHLASINDFIAMASKVGGSARLFTVAPAWIAQSILESSDLMYTETTGWSRDSSTRVDIDSYDNALALGDRDEIITSNNKYESPGEKKKKGVYGVESCVEVERVREKLRRYVPPPPGSKEDSVPPKKKTPKDTKKGANSNKTPKKTAATTRSVATPSSSNPKDKLYSEEDGTLPEGWRLEAVPRANGHNIDRYWYTKTEKKLRSKVEVGRFLLHVEAAAGDEELAFEWLRGRGGKSKPKKKVTPVKNNELSETDKNNGLRGGRKRKSNVDEDVANKPDIKKNTSSKDDCSKDKDSNCTEETAENPKGSKRRRSNEDADAKKIPDAEEKTASNDNASNSNKETPLTPREIRRRRSSNGKGDETDVPAAKKKKASSKDEPADIVKKVEVAKKRETRRSSLDEIGGEKDNDGLVKRQLRKRTSFPLSYAS